MVLVIEETFKSAHTTVMTDKQQHKGILVISRHGESEWNLLGKWTGTTDVMLTDKGRADSTLLGELLDDIDFDIAYTSDLKRTNQTLDALLEGKNAQRQLRRRASAAFNERDYGDYTGMNKWEVKEKVGEEEFNNIRRGWAHPIPNGENLKEVHERVVPYFVEEISPRLQAGENVLLVAHGNSIRALMKYLEEIDERDMAEVEMPFGQLLIYHFDSSATKPVKKEIRKANITPPKA